MFIIEAESEDIALRWGNEISQKYAVCSGEPFVKSAIEDLSIYSSCSGFFNIPNGVVGDNSFDPFS